MYNQQYGIKSPQFSQNKQFIQNKQYRRKVFKNGQSQVKLKVTEKFFCNAEASEQNKLKDYDLLQEYVRRSGLSQDPEYKKVKGKVYLVGTGPGDPELITLKALKILQQADVVLYDRLVQQEILDFVNKNAQMIYVGKQRGFHTRTQEEIIQLLYAFAQEGARVVRVKGGDPFIFGRGGEEMQYLFNNGIQIECVPGITAAAGVCASLGIPQTHRGISYSVRYLSGHAQEGSQDYLDQTIGVSHDPYTTLVIYMGLQNLDQVSRKLQQAGLKPDCPACVVENGTTPKQRVSFGTIETITSLSKKYEFKSPSLVIVGNAVTLSPFSSQEIVSGQLSELNEQIDISHSV